MVKDIRRVKTKQEIRNNFYSAWTPQFDFEKELMNQFIDLDPVYSGNDIKFQIVDTRILWQHTVLDFVKNQGLWCEFGVRGGDTIKWLLQKKPTQEIHGFDSWEGLPEDWVAGSKTYSAGSMEVPMPVFDSNVKLYKGWFDKTLEPWLEDHKEQIAYLHIDCDLYSSTDYVLKTLNDQIKKGTLIVFDELANWRLTGKMNNWWIHEWRAMCEWIDRNKRSVKPVARSCMYQAAIEVLG